MILRLRSSAKACFVLFVVSIAVPCGAADVGDWSMVSRALASAASGGPSAVHGALLSSPHGGATDFTPHGTQPGLAYDILAPESQCSSCHAVSGDDPDPAAATAFRPFTSWGGSMMANATRDPLFWAALDIANNDVPGVGDYCLRCHTPRGWLQGRVVKPGFNPPNDPVMGAAGCLLSGAYDSADDVNSDFGGVTCHFCHRLMPTGPNGEPAYTDNANAWVDDVQCPTGGGPCRRGPYDYPQGGPDQPPPHEWVYSEYHTQSALCENCHNVSTPDTDAGPLRTLKLNDGTDTALPFPIERTFDEWQQSDYAQASGGQTCQNCHMPESEDPGATACVFRTNNRTGNLPVHTFAGGNTWVPGIIKGQYANGIYNNGGFDRSTLYDQTIAWARELLGTAAAVTTTIQNYTPPGSGAGSLALQVKVTNNSGHKLPSGYAEGRRMWVNLQVKDANGALVFESAAYDGASGVLTLDSQARVYEVLQGIWNHQGTGACDVEDADGDAMFHFVLNDCIAKDNRITPLGFKPATTNDPNGYGLRPVGATYPETSPGSGTLVNYDTISYAVVVPAGTPGPLTATARLYYQTSSKDYIEFLRDQAVENATPNENAMCMGAASRPFVVGPQGRTRGEYAYNLWNDATTADRIFGDGFDGVAPQYGYGKSPPELVQWSAATTPSK